MAAEGIEGGQRIRRRRVFYLPGYDPFHPRRYRELYRKEGAEQARLCGYEIALRPSPKDDRYGWQVTASIEGAVCESWIEVLVWSDIVKASMSDSIAATYAQLLRTAWIYLSTGALWRLTRLRKGPTIAALYPVLFLLLQLLLALALAAGAGMVLGSLLHRLAGLLAAPLVLWLVLRWFRAKDNRVFAWYLMHDYAWSAQHYGAYPRALEARLAAFCARIRAALEEADPADEVLVVGHSSGAYLGVSVLADLLRECPARPGRELSFLSLGQVVPMVSYLPKAQRLRADLQFLASSQDLTWIDVSAPGDGCSFALCDPVSVSVPVPEGRRWPLVLSAAFTRTLSPARWQALRWRWFRLHFQYLCAFDQLPGRVDDYDYFRITAGPLSLAARLGARQPSRSRKEALLNRYQDLAP
ncbi:hypothetical protein [Pseudogemmobacter faecipullorum]|uniref:Uncharacterized protein n=1 Tax=Pseudogemmobacter faecipullorum TaxID=2755041 RepID=A0ABS8CLZ5_9RHOB|nr:hypothetical protein [Pseudogemmobacter faecipullorum]MCB5410235.1 hypothetical protein [Pseudogemmobacter faecipullorum]